MGHICGGHMRWYPTAIIRAKGKIVALGEQDRRGVDAPEQRRRLDHGLEWSCADLSTAGQPEKVMLIDFRAMARSVSLGHRAVCDFTGLDANLARGSQVL